ncbi:MAG: 23S rRNA (uracil(1939)-C(5))-methyltransferase RlmD [Myxococcales bacterium]|nr:23S rRNA (uracil(1939)-C(5))-methyltransferase RlmD [Myxococcales bacterium]
MDSGKVEVTAFSLDPQGAGVGVVDGREYHIADLLPGERAVATLDHQSPHRAVAWGSVLRRVGLPSPHRVTPSCPAFGRCGGCTWQHLDYPAQLDTKRLRVLDAFAAAAQAAPAGSAAAQLANIDLAPVVPSPRRWGYRNKGKYVAGLRDTAKSGGASPRFVLGAYQPRSHVVVETLGCQVVEPVIDEVATWAAGAAGAAGLAPYVERTGAGLLRYLVVRANHDGDVLVGAVVPARQDVAKLEPLASALARHPAVRSVLALVNARRDGSIAPAGAQVVTLSGDDKLVERVAGQEVRVGVGEFLQVNREQAEAMYAAVAELAAARPGTRAVDLYSGVGGIAMALAGAGAQVDAVELNGEAAAALAEVSRAAGLPITVHHADAQELRLPGHHADVVVVNPPRRGLSRSGQRAVLDLAPRRLLYVSCGPETLAQDLSALCQGGYRVDRALPFDLMPGTGQVETVVSLERQ